MSPRLRAAGAVLTRPIRVGTPDERGGARRYGASHPHHENQHTLYVVSLQGIANHRRVVIFVSYVWVSARRAMLETSFRPFYNGYIPASNWFVICCVPLYAHATLQHSPATYMLNIIHFALIWFSIAHHDRTDSFFTSGMVEHAYER